MEDRVKTELDKLLGQQPQGRRIKIYSEYYVQSFENVDDLYHSTDEKVYVNDRRIWVHISVSAKNPLKLRDKILEKVKGCLNATPQDSVEIQLKKQKRWEIKRIECLKEQKREAGITRAKIKEINLAIQELRKRISKK